MKILVLQIDNLLIRLNTEGPKPPETVRATATAVGCMAELDRKFLVAIVMAHFVCRTVRYQDRAELECPLLHGPHSIATEGNMQAAEGNCHKQSCWAMRPISPQIQQPDNMLSLVQ